MHRLQAHPVFQSSRSPVHLPFYYDENGNCYPIPNPISRIAQDLIQQIPHPTSQQINRAALSFILDDPTALNNRTDIRFVLDDPSATDTSKPDTQMQVEQQATFDSNEKSTDIIIDLDDPSVTDTRKSDTQMEVDQQTTFVSNEENIDISLDEPEGSTSQPKKRGRKAIDKSRFFCTLCGFTETPEWRFGPNGFNTLCNKCGLSYAKFRKNKGSWKQRVENAKMHSSIEEFFLQKALDYKQGDTCATCGIEKSYQWRRGPKNETLCNICGQVWSHFKQENPAP